MMGRIAMTIGLSVFCLAGLGAATLAVAQTGHPSFLPPLQRDDEFPRFTLEELMENGYPDHQHGYFSKTWTPLKDDRGRPYGVGSICRGMTLLPVEGLVSSSGRLSYGPITFRFNPDYQPCQVAPFLELCDMALHLYRDLLDLEAVGSLTITNPDKVADYAASTGYGTWRTFRLEGDHCIVQPVNVLSSRTLIAHAAIDLVGQWLIREKTDRLPEWLINGVGCYIGEMGTHFLSYMAQYRTDGSILLSPGDVEKSLRAPVVDDPGLDKRMFRVARYSAFLMVWRLVENNGGLDPLAGFLKAVSAGEDPDAAARAFYGRDIETLAADLDPKKHGEPVGAAVAPRNPNRIPVRGPEKQGP